MLLLAFDTSGTTGFAGSVALLDEGRIVAAAPLDAKQRSAQSLAPAIDRLLSTCGAEPGQLQLIATTIGPGSFTGLRVGVTTAKTLAYAVGAAVLGISTLEALAARAVLEPLGSSSADVPRPAPPGEVQAILDAQRGELFLGRFRFAACASAAGQEEASAAGLPPLTRLAPDQIIAARDWLAGLTPGTLVTGPGLKRLETQLPPEAIAMPPERREVRAGVVGRLAWRDYLAGCRDDLWKLAPVYLRPSYAEEKAKQAGP